MKKRLKNLTVLTVAITLLMGCGSKNDYRSELSDEELEEGKASFTIDENLNVDASITPLSLYEDGINTYYCEYLYDEDDNHLFGNKIEDVFDIIDKRVESKNITEPINNSVDFICSNYTSYNFHWFHFNREFSERYNSPSFELVAKNDFDIQEEVNSAWNRYNGNSIYCRLMSAKEDLEYLSVEAAAKEEIEYLESILNSKICTTYDCTTINDSNLEKLAEIDSEFSGIGSAGVGCYFFKFYKDIDGLPLDDFSMRYKLKPNQTCTDAARYVVDNSFLDTNGSLVTYITNPYIVLANNNYIYIDVIDKLTKGEIYKESQEIVSVNEIIGNIKEYYETKLLTKPVTVTDIRLVYSMYFTTEEEVVDNAICPFWRVTVYDEQSQIKKLFLYDAVSGELMIEARDYSPNYTM